MGRRFFASRFTGITVRFTFSLSVRKNEVRFESIYDCPSVPKEYPKIHSYFLNAKIRK